jgi:hypothetical protein
MTDTKRTPGPVAIKAALTIFNSTVNPAQRHEASHVTTSHFAEIIEQETNVTELRRALEELHDAALFGCLSGQHPAMRDARAALATDIGT